MVLRQAVNSDFFSPDVLSEATMQSIASEMNLSETAFVSLKEREDNFRDSQVNSAILDKKSPQAVR